MKKKYQKPCIKVINISTCDIIAASSANQSKKRTHPSKEAEQRGWNNLWSNN